MIDATGTAAKFDEPSTLVTMFAPDDDAFARLGPSQLQHWLDPSNKRETSTLVLFHAAYGDILTTALKPDWSYSFKAHSVSEDILLYEDFDDADVAAVAAGIPADRAGGGVGQVEAVFAEHSVLLEPRDRVAEFGE